MSSPAVSSKASNPQRASRNSRSWRTPSPTARSSPRKPSRSRSSRAWEYPRPSPALGNSISMRLSSLRSAARSSTASAGASRTPSPSRCPPQRSGSARRAAKEIVSTGFAAGSAGSSRSRRMRIGSLPEGRQPDAAHGIDETLFLTAQCAIGLNHSLDRRSHFVLPNRRSEHLTERREAVGRATEADLIPLLAVLIDAEHADVTDMMMAAGVHATGHLDFDLAQVVEVVEIVETLLYLAGNRDRAGVGESAEIESGAGDHVRERADVGCGEAVRRELLPRGMELVLRHVGEQQILAVGAAYQSEAEAIGEARNGFHLLRGHVTRDRVVRLERDEDRAVAGHAMRACVVAIPGLKGRLASTRDVDVGQRLVVRWAEAGAHSCHFGAVEACGVLAAERPFRLHLLAKGGGAERLHQYLDACLVDVVAASVAVVDAQNRLEISEQVCQRQELADHCADRRRTPQTAADPHREADTAAVVAPQLQADVVYLGGRPVLGRTGHRDLELARQVREFRMERCPLADDLAVRPRIIDLLRGDARQMIGGDVAYAVAARLDRMHLHCRQLGEDLGNIGERRPVQLQVLSGGEVAIAAVIAARDVRERAQLAGGKQPIGNRDAQHRRVALDVEPVTQPQRTEVVLGELTGQIAPRLIAEFRDPLIDKRLIELVVTVHGPSEYRLRSRGRLNTEWLGCPFLGL